MTYKNWLSELIREVILKQVAMLNLARHIVERMSGSFVPDLSG